MLIKVRKVAKASLASKSLHKATYTTMQAAVHFDGENVSGRLVAVVVFHGSSEFGSLAKLLVDGVFTPVPNIVLFPGVAPVKSEGAPFFHGVDVH